jgi:hypothetical protein
MFGKHADVNSFPMLAIDQEVFYIKVEVSKKMLSVRVLNTPKALEPRKFVSMWGHGCICAPRRSFFKIRFQNREKRI